MYKPRKITIQIVIGLMGALGTLITALVMIKESTKPLIADVNCVCWKAPQTLVTKAKLEDANNLCSMYTVNIYNKDKYATEETQMSIQRALYWEVAWKDDKGPQKREYSGNELISLPDIQSGRNVNVKAWATCKAARPSKKEIQITQKRSYPARLNVITPVRASVQFLDQLISRTPIYFLVFFGIALISIYILIKKWYFSRKHPQPIAVEKENGN